MGKKVEFGKRFALVGVISGLVLALGVPLLAIIGNMPTGIVCAVMIVSVLTGGAIILVSSFFGIVLPTVAEDDTPRRPMVVKSMLSKTIIPGNGSVAPKPQTNGQNPSSPANEQPKN